MNRLTKDFKFTMKAVEDNGSFEGLAAVYGNIDLGGDIIEPGAFTRTMKANGGEVPLLWQHDQREPIGIGRLQDSEKGLVIHGELVMESDVARKAHSLMKAKVLKGLSIGYDTVVTEYDKTTDTRKLKELKLWEVSLVTFPMNPKAKVTVVKGFIDEFSGMLQLLEEEVKSGQGLSVASLDELKSLHARILALMPADSDLHSAALLAKQQISDPGIHSLVESFKQFELPKFGH